MPIVSTVALLVSSLPAIGLAPGQSATGPAPEPAAVSVTALPHWAGYAVTRGETSRPINEVAAHWKVAPIICPKQKSATRLLYTWAGIGGVEKGDTLYQIGVVSGCDGGQPSYQVMAQSIEPTTDARFFPEIRVTGGDLVTAVVRVDSSANQAEVILFRDDDQATVAYHAYPYSLLTDQSLSAECILERPVLFSQVKDHVTYKNWHLAILPKFGKQQFDWCSVRSTSSPQYFSADILRPIDELSTWVPLRYDMYSYKKSGRNWLPVKPLVEAEPQREWDPAQTWDDPLWVTQLAAQ